MNTQPTLRPVLDFKSLKTHPRTSVTAETQNTDKGAGLGRGLRPSTTHEGQWMMLGRFGFSVALALVALPRVAMANQPSADDDQPVPTAITCSPAGKGIRECYPAKYQAHIVVKTFLGATTVVDFPEPITFYVSPSAQLFSTKEPRYGVDRSVVLTAIKKDIGPEVSAFVRAGHYSITLSFEVQPSATDADVQLNIVPYHLRGQDRECVRRLELARAGFESELPGRVDKETEKQLLVGLAGSNYGSARAKPARNDHIIIKARQWLTINGADMVSVHLENADTKPFTIGPVTLEVRRGKKRTELRSNSRCRNTRLTSRQTTICWVSAAELGRPLHRDERFVVKVSSQDQRRSVTSRPIEKH